MLNTHNGYQESGEPLLQGPGKRRQQKMMETSINEQLNKDLVDKFTQLE
jgi:hypothetical protein